MAPAEVTWACAVPAQCLAGQAVEAVLVEGQHAVEEVPEMEGAAAVGVEEEEDVEGGEDVEEVEGAEEEEGAEGEDDVVEVLCLESYPYKVPHNARWAEIGPCQIALAFSFTSVMPFFMDTRAAHSTRVCG